MIIETTVPTLNRDSSKNQIKQANYSHLVEQNQRNQDLKSILLTLDRMPVKPYQMKDKAMALQCVAFMIEADL